MSFEIFIQTYPEKESTGMVPEKDILEIEQQLSPALADFLRKEGTAFYDNGFLATVNPLQWTDLGSMVGPPDEKAFIVLRTSFGDCYIWMKNAVYLFQASYHKYLEITDDISYLFDVFLVEKGFADTFLFRNKHAEARKLHGKLAYDEVYGFVPALPLGGNENIQTMAIVKLKEYNSMLLQLFKNED